jgi:TRAP-type C4-dicarboxylate transport system substrate-binding protein
MDAGARSFYNKERPIRTPEDLQGLKIRVMQNPIFIDMMSEMGGSGIPIAFNELYTAMQTGVVDGAENNPPSYSTQKHYEQAGYYSLTEHLIVPEIFVFSKRVWDTLSEEHQNLIREAAVLTTQKERELWEAMEGKAMEDLKALGVQINDDVDKAAFIEATAPVREKFGAQYAELLARIEAVE